MFTYKELPRGGKEQIATWLSKSRDLIEKEQHSVSGGSFQGFHFQGNFTFNGNFAKCKEMKYSRNNQVDSLISKELQGNSLFKELSLVLQAKFSFKFSIFRIFNQHPKFQLNFGV